MVSQQIKQLLLIDKGNNKSSQTAVYFGTNQQYDVGFMTSLPLSSIPICSAYMGYFSFHNQGSIQDFWSSYTICYYSYIASIFLWTIQLAVTILRLATMADFQFVTVSVDATDINTNEVHKEKIQKALKSSGLKPAADLFPSEEDMFVSEDNVAYTHV